MKNEGMNYKMYIIVNNSLDMKKGKIAAQVSHAVLGLVLDGASKDYEDNLLKMNLILDKNFEQWYTNSFTKVCLKAKDADEMDIIAALCSNFNLKTKQIVDNGNTQVPPGSKTALAIWPFDVNDPKYTALVIDLGQLKLL